MGFTAIWMNPCPESPFQNVGLETERFWHRIKREAERNALWR